MSTTSPSFLAQGMRNDRFPDPFNDLASAAMPRTMPDALRWCQGIAQVDPTFREAMERVASYFITDVEVRASSKSNAKKISKEAKDKFEEFLTKSLQILTQIRRAALDFLIYGNSFTSLLPPIRRFLYCPDCPSRIYALKVVHDDPQFAYRWDGGSCEFHAKCPNCKRHGAWTRIDRQGGPESDMAFKHWNPHEIEIIHDPWTDRRDYIWKIPDTYRREIRQGILERLETVPWEVVEAIRAGDNFRFAAGVVYHMWEPPLAGFDHAGWGIAKALTNFRQAWHSQMLRRFNEAICQEFLVPFRVLSPEPRAGGDAAVDPMIGTNMLNFRAQMAAMVRRHRQDPGVIQISPVPVHYQMLGGEASQLAPYQLIDQATDALLNGAGVPAELYKGTLTLQAAPVGLRLFESRWRALVDQLNLLVEAVVDRVAGLFSWEAVDAKLKKVKHADDMNRQMAVLQLMMGGQISQQTGLDALGLNFTMEQDQLIEEQEYVAEKQEEVAERQQGTAAYRQMGAASGASPFAGQPQGGAPPGGAPQGGQGGGQPPPGGDPSSQPGGGDPTQATPQEIDDQGSQIAAQLQAAPDDQRRSTLVQLKRESPVLHGVVKQKMEDQRSQASSQGQQQVLQQQFGKAGRTRVPSVAELRRLSSYRRSA